MKLRVRHNSIRFRLGQSEVERLRQGQECRETIVFPGNHRLEYSVAAHSGETIGASFTGSTVRVVVPKSHLAAWCGSSQVGLWAEIALPECAPLCVLIEKDFRCLDDRVLEDQSDTFDNPLAQHAVCEAS